MENAPEILSALKSPLGLAALSLLILGQVLKLILSKKKTQLKLLESIVQKSFLIATILGVLSICAYVWEASLTTEIRVSGSVRDSNGQPIQGVMVEIAGVAKDVSKQQGEFEFSIPASRSARTYDIDAILTGFQPFTMKIEGPRPKPIRIILKGVPWSSDSIITFSPIIVVRHVIGLPQIDVKVTFDNPSLETVQVQDIMATLVAPNGRSIPMIMSSVYMPAGGLGPALPMLTLTSHQKFPLAATYVSDLEALQTLQFRIAGNLQRLLLPPMPPLATDHILPEKMVSYLRQFASQHFVWTEGKWIVTVSVNIGDKTVSRSATFQLTATQVSAMKGITEFYSSGIGVIPAWFALEAQGTFSQLTLPLSL